MTGESRSRLQRPAHWRHQVTAVLLSAVLSLAARGQAVPPTPHTEGDALDSIARVRRVMQQMVQAEVQSLLRETHESMNVNPDAAAIALRAEAERIRHAPELDVAVRRQLLSGLQAAWREASRRSAAQHVSEVQHQQAQQELQARSQLQQELRTRQRSLERTVAHSNDLALQGEHRAAADAAQRVGRAAPSTMIGAAAPLEAEMRANSVAMNEMAERQRRGLMNEYRTQEAQMIVRSDGQPVSYPSAERWQELTERRRQWRENASTYRPSEAEAKINRALREKTSVDFRETPLADALDYLKARHGIEIALDGKGMSEAGVGPSTPITRNLNNISLRSVLKLILGDLSLSYVVKDDVLLITSVEAADSMTTVRVYDVGDLVIPIPDPRQTPGFMPF